VVWSLEILANDALFSHICWKVSSKRKKWLSEGYQIRSWEAFGLAFADNFTFLS